MALAFKLFATPILIGSITLAGRSLIAIAIWNRMTWSLSGAFLLILAVIALVSWSIPKPAEPAGSTPPPAWDFPARMVLAAGFGCKLERKGP